MNNSLEIVTLVSVELHRLGTASGRNAFGMNKREHKETREVLDGQLGTIRDAVAAIAMEQGESEEDLAYLAQVSDYRYGGPKGQFLFNVDVPGANVTYTNAYATCQVFTALKIDDRYFKIEEIQV